VVEDLAQARAHGVVDLARALGIVVAADIMTIITMEAATTTMETALVGVVLALEHYFLG